MWIKTQCAICGTHEKSKPVYESPLDERSFSIEVFSARRMPDRRHYAWVRCDNCGLLRSDPISDTDLAMLYEESTFDYSAEIGGLGRTYAKIVKKALRPKKLVGSILEVGGGNSFFLEQALKMGFSEVHGIEPSIDAVAATRSDIKPTVVVGLMENGVFPDEKFDVVAMFHVMDHLPSPLDTLSSIVKSLRPGGTLVVAVHNEKSWSARLLGEKSPIVDVEHTYLYSKETAKKLFEKAGLYQVKSKSYFNFYSLAYLMQLIPLPKKFKVTVLNSRYSAILRKVRIHVPLGNIFVSGVK